MKRHVSFGVTAEAVGRQMASLSTQDTWHMLMMVAALQRMIAGRVTVHATRVLDQSSELAKDGAGTLCAIRNRSKFGCALERSTCQRLSCRRLICARASCQHEDRAQSHGKS
jgi:hypothetical protein